jgi:hypothetical protein
MRRFVRLAELKQTYGKSSVGDSAKALPSCCPRLSGDNHVPSFRIEEYPLGFGKVPFLKDRLDLARESIGNTCGEIPF